MSGDVVPPLVAAVLEREESVPMKTRNLLILSVVTGLAILVAFAVQILLAR